MELKPCPFCGGEPRLVEEISLAKVACMNRGCDVEPETPWFWSVDEAAEAWNTRAERTCKRTLMDWTGNPPYYTGGLALNDICNGCSECGYPWRTHGFDHPNFCPNCGAKVVEA